MNQLGSALTEAMTGSNNDLHVFDTAEGTWHRHPWAEVHARAENVAERICAEGADTVGLVGDPNVEFLAAITGALIAGAAVSILPGPVRGADPQRWAHATLARFEGVGAHTLFSHGAHLRELAIREPAGGL